MPKILTIGTDEFEFPLEGENAGYGSEITDWAEAVTSSLSTVERPGDLINKTAPIADSQLSLTSIPEFSFSSAIVASFEAKYLVERTSSAGAWRESGHIEGYHDGSDWIIAIRAIGNSRVDFNITNLGQVQYKTNASLGGTSYNGFIKFEAKVINK